MSDTKHTPGPWRSSGDEIWADNVPDLGTVVVARINRYWQDLDLDPEYDANVSVMTAAPDLLAALENLIGDQGHYFYCTHWHAGAEGKCSKRCIEIREAIAKAKRERP
jgi:hypothetical protein